MTGVSRARASDSTASTNPRTARRRSSSPSAFQHGRGSTTSSTGSAISSAKRLSPAAMFSLPLLLQRLVQLNHWKSRLAGPSSCGRHVSPGLSALLSTR